MKLHSARTVSRSELRPGQKRTDPKRKARLFLTWPPARFTLPLSGELAQKPTGREPGDRTQTISNCNRNSTDHDMLLASEGIPAWGYLFDRGLRIARQTFAKFAITGDGPAYRLSEAVSCTTPPTSTHGLPRG